MRLKRRLLVTVMSVLLVGPLAATTSQATQSPSGPSDADSMFISSNARVTVGGGSGAELSSASLASLDDQGGDPAVLAYWTHARMAAAQASTPGVLPRPTPPALPAHHPPGSPPVPMGKADASTQTAPSEGDVISHPAEPISTSSNRASASDYELDGTRVAGKLFFINNDGDDSYCSASVVNSDSKRMIVTAGHCIHGGAGKDWNTDMVFAPRYDETAADPTPVGVWQAASWRTFKVWGENGGRNLTVDTEEAFARDIAFVTLYKGGDGMRAKIVSRLGGNGFNINRTDAWPATVVGYPRNRQAGEVAQVCNMWTAEDPVWWYRWVTPCNFAPGSSGGPWYDVLGTNGLGYVQAVTSTWQSTSGVNGAAYFDTAVVNMYHNENDDGENL